MSFEEVLDNAWVLFEHLEDIPSEKLLDAVEFFIERYDFNMNALPGNIFDGMSERMLRREIEGDTFDYAREYIKGWE